MSTKYSSPSVEAILEYPEHDSKTLRLEGDDYEEFSWRQQDPYPKFAMPTTKSSSGKERERSRRHRSTHTGSKSTKSRTKSTSGKGSSSDENRARPRRSHSRSSSASPYSSDVEEAPRNHRDILAARSRLTSPSVVSNLTCTTASTKKSSGSSGSNSTITQASMLRKSSLGKRSEVSEPEKQTEVEETPLSPAVPDAPDVFAYLESEPSPEDFQEHSQTPESASTTTHTEVGLLEGYSVSPTQPSERASTSSESSSFQGDENSSKPQQHDTDRSTSPEISEGQEDDVDATPTDDASAKIAAQMAAAQQRQNIYGAVQSFGTPEMQRGNAVLPHIPSSALASRTPHHVKRLSLPRGEKLPVTGYELLASRLSSSTEMESSARIRPIYRKFEALNHRLLLHLQDEISELEEQLHRLDNADTQSRRITGLTVPASRRAAAQAGGELQWHKTDILGRIGFKLAQYNQTLTSFNQTQTLPTPAASEISHYRDYLSTHQPIAEPETRFLDPADDLVSMCSATINAPSSSSESSTVSSSTSFFMPSQSTASIDCSSLAPSEIDVKIKDHLPTLATAIAVTILNPILTFSVIPGFVGRLVVLGLVAGGTLGALIQSGVVDGRGLFAREGMVCAGIYGGAMVCLAGIV